MQRGYVVGVELNQYTCQISYCAEGQQEPKTIERIPLVIGKKEKDWVYGEKAGEEGIYDLLSLAVKHELIQVGENTYEGIWLLSLYIQLVLKQFQNIETIAFTLPNIDVDIVHLLKSVGQKLGVPKEKVYVQDNRESFCYYMFYQPRELWQYESALFYCDEDGVRSYMMKRLYKEFGKTQDNFVTVDEVANIDWEALSIVYPPEDEEGQKRADEHFNCFIKSVFNRRLISSVFLIGEGFEKNWYPNSLRTLCNGRRAFQGDNLYSKGACYTAQYKSGKQSDGIVYLDETKMTEQICLKLRINGRDIWYPIVQWGTKWYENDKQFEILLEDTDDIEVHVESLTEHLAKTVKVSLENLPKREKYTLRLQVNVIFQDEHTCIITWKDVGFGNFFEPSGFHTQTVIKLGGRDGQFNSLS